MNGRRCVRTVSALKQPGQTSTYRLLASRGFTCTALAALVFAFRCWLIAEWGSPVPFWDQWGVESSLYRAWLTSSLQWSDLFAAHNEHRIPLTKLADLALFALCGHWNLWAQLQLNGVLHAVTAGLLAAAFWDSVSSRTRVPFLLGVTCLFCSTAGWQNALWGFQSGVYFSSLFTVVAFFGFARQPSPARELITNPNQWRSPAALASIATCCISFAALILASLSNAGGVITAIITVALSWPRTCSSRAWLTWVGIVGILGAALALRVSAPHHAPLQARSLAQFLEVFLRCLGWPHVNSAWAWMAMQLPIVLLFIRRWQNGYAGSDRLAFALAAFAVLQAAAIGYTRGAGLPEFRPLSRYQDPLLLGAAAQLYAAIQLAAKAGRPGRLVLIGWSSLALVGAITLTATHLSLNLPYKRLQDTEGLVQIRTYLKTGDSQAFSPDTNVFGPNPNPAEIVRILDDPILRPALPRAFFLDAPRPLPITYATLLVWMTFGVFGTALVVSAQRDIRDSSGIP